MNFRLSHETQRTLAMDYSTEALKKLGEHHGQLATQPLVPVLNKDDLSTTYTPGVAAPCREIHANPERVWDLTLKHRSVAVVTDGSAVLGLGNIGPEAGLPVMEGKCVLFKRFANIDAWPICLATQDADEIVETVKRISPGFGAIQLEDISAPRCFDIEVRLQSELSIPVMHDDQHGTATVVLAGLLNALKVVEKRMETVRVVISGAGAAGLAVGNLLVDAGVRSVRMLDTHGVLSPGREGLNVYKEAFVKRTFALDTESYGRDLPSVLRGADIFSGVSKPGLLGREEIRSMANRPIVCALSNPVPEIMPDEAKAGGAFIVATGRSDFPNQINNVLAYPGLFRGVLARRAPAFTAEMFVAASHAIADHVLEPTPDRILPSVFDDGLVDAVADAVMSV